MKLSKYNFCVETENNTCIIYNTLKNTYIKMGSKRFHQLSTNINEFIGTSQFKEDIKILLESGIILEDNVDEVLLVKNQYFEKCYNSSCYNVTLIPTLLCNLKCDYCFVEQDDYYMDDFIINQVIDYLKKCIKDKRHYLKHFNMKWFGGEPLLYPDIISKISKPIIEFCKLNKINYYAMIYSNLTLLDDNRINVLRSCKINKINTTLDGFGIDNDIRRMSKNGKSYFFNIIDNIKKLKENKFSVNIQVNIDKRNIGSIKTLINYLKKEKIVDGESITIGFNLVNDNSNISDKGILYSYEENIVMNQIDEFYRLLGLKAANTLPTKALNCFALANNSVVIDPRGNLYKCFKDTKKNISFGNVSQSEYQYSNNKYQNLLYNPFNNKRCIECNVFPICFGGCPNFGSDENICSLKYILSYKIKRNFRE